MATATDRVRLGTCVTPLPRRRPWKLAREALTLDHLSGGRAVLGVGLGDLNDHGWAAFGEPVDDRERAGLADNALDIIRGLWTGESFSYRGGRYAVDPVTFRPRPVQSPSLPVWVGGGWPGRAVIGRAARCDGICAYRRPHDGDWA